MFINFRKYSKKTVLVITAHTDDADYNCGAAVARLSDAGARVVYVVCTKGEKGTMNRGLSTDELVKTRRAEQDAANRTLGVSETIHFDYPDGELKSDFELQGRLTALIRELRPELMLTFDPEWPEHRQHPDHRACAVAAIRANSFSPLFQYFPEQVERGAEPFQCPRILLFDVFRNPDTFVSVGSMFRRKCDAMLAHESQIAHLLRDDQKKTLEAFMKIPFDSAKQILIGALAPAFIVETFRSLRAGDTLR
jgi:LmbE family N-acetylglucosaminyl deacetylase